jgi:hypothetical protein
VAIANATAATTHATFEPLNAAVMTSPLILTIYQLAPFCRRMPRRSRRFASIN